jgi:hypothetical protein
LVEPLRAPSRSSPQIGQGPNLFEHKGVQASEDFSGAGV